MRQLAGVAWLSLLIVVPGLGASLAAYRAGEIGLPGRVATILGFGYAVPGGIAFVLALLGVLHAPVFFVLLALATVALWYVGLSRSSPAAHRRALVAEVRSDPWPVALGLAVILAIAVLRARFLRGFPVLAPFRYWVDAVEIADTGGIPELSVHYGALYPTATSKAFLNAFNAGASFVVGNAPIALVSLLWIGSVGLAAALWAAARELGLRLTAPLLPVLAMANHRVLNGEMTRDLVGYRAENVGRMLAFAALGLGILALRDRRRRDAVVAGALFAVSAGTHLVPTLVAGVFLGWYLVARLVLDRERRALLVQAAWVAALVVAVAGAILLLPRGTIGFQGAQTGRYEEVPGLDPTEYLLTGRMAERTSDSAYYLPPGRILLGYTRTALGVTGLDTPMADFAGWFRWVLPAAGLAAAVAMLLWFPGPLRAVGLAAWGLGFVLVLVALFFSYRYDRYILGWFGIRRMFDFTAIPIILIGLALVEAGTAWLGRIRTWAPLAAGTLAVALLAAWILPTARPPTGYQTETGRAIALLDWIRANTECDARILASERSTGVFKAMTGRQALLEGMGPFLRPDMLNDVVRLLLGARAFFADPVANRDFVERNGIDYVLVLKQVHLGYPAPIRRGQVDRIRNFFPPHFLEPVEIRDGFEVYRVVGLEEPPGLLDPAGQPGFRCRRDPIEF